MIGLLSNLPALNNEMGEVIRMFFREKVVYELSNGLTMLFRHKWEYREDAIYHIVTLDGYAFSQEVKEYSGDLAFSMRFQKYAAKQCLYRLLVQYTGRTMPWGGLTGVRPTKMLSMLHKMGLDGEMVFLDFFNVSLERIGLSKEICTIQESMKIPVDSIAIYIGIPFCVSRCHYCSFPGIVAKREMMEAYVDVLLREMEAAERAIKKQNKSINSVYIGGGTPTSLDVDLLERLLAQTARLFPTNEFTLEAGRSDTITKEKLLSAKRHGVNRLCINPQSMNQQTLTRIGRTHGLDTIKNAYVMAQDMGFSSINADLIAGLEEETTMDFLRSLEKTMALHPSSITVHTLALKRGSKLHDMGYVHQKEERVTEMVNEGRDMLKHAGYFPYYLYRQKYIAGNLENVGYAKPGHTCIYNVCMMDDLSSVLALGEGAITKIVTKGCIERYANPKDISLYMEREQSISSKYEHILL